MATPAMVLPSIQPRFLGGAYGAEQDFRSHQELARLRRLEDLRGYMHPSRHNSSAPRPPSQGGSTPNLHDFHTKTHLARLDLAYESLDAHLQKCMEQMLSALSEQSKSMEEWVEQKLVAGTSATVAADGHGQTASVDADVLRRLASLEERKTPSPSFDIDLHARMAVVEEKLADASSIGCDVRPSLTAFRERLSSAESMETETRSRLAAFEERLSAVASRGAEMQASPAVVEDRVAALSTKLGGFEVAVGELTRQVSDNAIAVEINTKLSASRAESMQTVAAEVSAKLDAEVANIRAVLADHAGAGQALDEQLESVREHVSKCVSAVATEPLRQRVDELASQLEAQRKQADAALLEHATERASFADDLAAIRKQSPVGPTMADIEALRVAVDDLSTQFEAEQAHVHPVLQEVARDRILVKQRLDAVLEQISAVSNTTGVACEKLDAAVADLTKQLASSRVQTQAAEATVPPPCQRSAGDESANGLADQSRDCRATTANNSGIVQHESWQKATEEKIRTLDSRMRQAVDVIAVTKVDCEEKLNSMKGHLRQISTNPQRSEHDGLVHRLEALERSCNDSRSTNPKQSEHDGLALRLEALESSYNDLRQVRRPEECSKADLDAVAERLQARVQELERRAAEPRAGAPASLPGGAPGDGPPAAAPPLEAVALAAPGAGAAAATHGDRLEGYATSEEHRRLRERVEGSLEEHRRLRERVEEGFAGIGAQANATAEEHRLLRERVDEHQGAIDGIGAQTKSTIDAHIGRTQAMLEKMSASRSDASRQDKAYATAEEHQRLRERVEHLEEGLDGIGAQTKSTIDAHIGKTQAMLEKLSASRSAKAKKAPTAASSATPPAATPDGGEETGQTRRLRSSLSGALGLPVLPAASSAATPEGERRTPPDGSERRTPPTATPAAPPSAMLPAASSAATPEGSERRRTPPSAAPAAPPSAALPAAGSAASPAGSEVWTPPTAAAAAPHSAAPDGPADARGASARGEPATRDPSAAADRPALLGDHSGKPV